MKRLASPATVAAGCGLILIVNLTILALAAWNRQGQPQAELSLTERELIMPTSRQDEDSELSLSLVLTHEPPGFVRRTARWKHYELPSVEYPWLDRPKLRDLGFGVDLDPSDPAAKDDYAHAMARRAYIVVEYDGEAWSRWLAGREEQVQQLRREVEDGKAERSALEDAEAVLALDRTMRSRLFPVDAGTDANALRRRYPDRRQHAVVEGLFRPKIVQPEDGAPFLSGRVLGLVAGRVHVSLKLRQHLETFLPEETWNEVEDRERGEAETGWPSPAPPRYRAALAFGHRHEPWLVSVTTLEPADGARPTAPTRKADLGTTGAAL